MAALVEFGIDDQRRAALWTLRDADQRAACVHLGDDPVAVEGLVGQHRIEGEPLDQRRDPNRVKAVPRYQDEPHELAKRIGQRQDLGRPAAPRLAYRLTLSPPFEPCPWR